LLGVGALRRQGCRRPHHGDRGRRLPWCRPGHPTPSRVRSGRTCGLKRGTHTPHRQVRSRVDHVFARMRVWRSCPTADSRAMVSTTRCSAWSASATLPLLDNTHDSADQHTKDHSRAALNGHGTVVEYNPEDAQTPRRFRSVD
jgi:hypothetical protein